MGHGQVLALISFADFIQSGAGDVLGPIYCNIKTKAITWLLKEIFCRISHNFYFKNI